MELLFEIIFEIIFDIGIEVSKEKKINKWIRYPLTALIIIIFVAVILLLIILGLKTLKSNIILGIFFIVLGAFLLIGSMLKFRKLYLSKK